MISLQPHRKWRVCFTAFLLTVHALFYIHSIDLRNIYSTLQDHNSNITIHGLQHLSEYDPYWLQHFQTKEALLSPNTVPTVPVVIFPFCIDGSSSSWDDLHTDDGTFYHLFQDGLDHSRVLWRVPQHASLADIDATGDSAGSGGMVQLDPHVVWMVAQKDRKSSRRVCQLVTREIRAMQELRAQLSLPTQWPIVFTQFTDGEEAFRCAAAEELMGSETNVTTPDFVSYVRRSIVKGRRWVRANHSIELGTVNYGFTGHTPIPVRTDTLASIGRVLRTQYSSGIHRDIESELPRPIDVSHFWPLNGREYGLVGFGAGLRRETTNRLLQLQREQQNTTIFCGITGRDRQNPRTALPDDSYPAKMLESKIIVVTQRDFWEDHYRLMEALISGAMVIQDSMLTLPDGLANGTSIIEFRDVDHELPRLIAYYLSHRLEREEIAREGRRVALSFHRTWQELEKIVFSGSHVTTCEGKYCPYQIYPGQQEAQSPW